MFVADNDGFLGNWGMNNYYLYRLADDHVFHFIDWDKSEAFKDTPDYWIWHNHLDVPETTRNRLWSRVMSYPDLKTLYLDTLLECANVAVGDSCRTRRRRIRAAGSSARSIASTR